MAHQENDPGKLRKIAKSLANSSHEAQFVLGDTLSVIHSTRCFREWGFHTWKDYVEIELHVNSSASYELLKISRWTQLEGLTLKQRRSLAEVGRTKAYCIAHLATKESLQTWIDVAKNETCERMRMRLFDDSPTEAPKTVSYWLYGAERKTVQEAQKLMLRKVGNNPRAGELLYWICNSYIALEHQQSKDKQARKKLAAKKKSRSKAKAV